MPRPREIIEENPVDEIDHEDDQDDDDGFEIQAYYEANQEHVCVLWL